MAWGLVYKTREIFQIPKEKVWQERRKVSKSQDVISYSFYFLFFD